MPFTLSHPAAALAVAPLLGRFAVPSALAIGTMAPDFPYFAALPIPRLTTHSLPSVLWFSLPVGWLAYLFIERVLRAPLVALLPRALRLRIERETELGSALAVTLSLVAGATTHVIWDAITHGSAGSVRAVPFLATLVREVYQNPQLSFATLQYGSSVVGAVALALYGWLWLRRTPERVADPDGGLPERLRSLGRALLLVAPPLVGLAVAVAWGPAIRDWATLAWFGAHIAVAGVTTGVGVLASAALWLQPVPGAPRKSSADVGTP